MSDLASLLHHDDTEPPKPDPETEQEESNSGGDGEDHDDSPAQSGTDSGDGIQEDDEDYVMKDEPSDDYNPVKNEPNNNTVKHESADADDDDDDEDKSDSTKAEVPTKVTQQSILSSFEKIKTHFPAARIKKIMQSDDDIGKVAQATPIIVGRALEIFMANLVECAIIESRKQGVKRISAMHIRAAVENSEQFDFLVDSVAKYPPMKH
ncbi:hypothetical protein DIURU_005591 [Diutina rugosa]|uniref:Transcription factor CBF/NF-Y/archaeal histone domain-containing protein n=1 Tax=Diutina rugosa TaxID=5481 RepID=A0A642UCX7_DIURU|nr:uncharacterized protein DIURU_005591 [Diutina rugosa]KAA8896851.1 hypothetical protein DIURU_005591 [Diutina rugosa]